MNTKAWRLRLLIVILASTVLVLTGKVNAVTFDLSFDNTAGGGVTPPLLGSGTFGFDGDTGDGSFALDTLVNVFFNVSLNDGNTFELADSEDSLSEVLAVITTVGADRILRFGNINEYSSGAYDGAFDLINGTGGFLTFEPGFTGGELYGSDSSFGSYAAVARTIVPIPSAVLLFSTGMLGLIGYVRQRKKLNV